MTTLYLCGAGNPEGVRLALNINKAHNRWDRIVVLDDDPSKHGQLILDIEIAGPFSDLEDVEPASAEVSNMVARTTKGRESARGKIQAYGLPFAPLIDPGVDMAGVDAASDITVYRNSQCLANARVGDGSVVLMGAIVGHGSRVGRCCVMAPGAVINARVELGEGVYVGTNASIMPDIKIGPWATIGANSAVVQDVPPGATVMGVPAQLIIPGEAYNSGREAQNLKRINVSAKTAEERTGIRRETLRKLRVAQQKFIRIHKPASR